MMDNADWPSAFVATNLPTLGYNPETDVILLLESGDRAAFLYLRNRPISPRKLRSDL